MKQFIIGKVKFGGSFKSETSMYTRKQTETQETQQQKHTKSKKHKNKHIQKHRKILRTHKKQTPTETHESTMKGMETNGKKEIQEIQKYMETH